MKYLGFVITYAPENGINCQSYFLNGSLKDDVGETGCVELFNTSTRRNLFAVVDASSSEISGNDVAYLCADALSGCMGLDFDVAYTDCFANANDIAKGRSFQAGGKRVCVNIGTLFLQNEYAKAYNAGDVPIFHYRDKKLKNLSGKMPKTVEKEEMIENDGEVEIKKVIKKTVPYIGYISDEHVVEPYISDRIKVKNKDIFLITTQSVIETVGEKTITDILEDDKLKIDEKAETIIDTATRKDPDGNYTVQITVAKDSVRFLGVKLGYIFIAFITALCILAGTMFGESIQKSAEALVYKWKILVNSFTYRDIKPEVVADPWVPLGRDEEEEKEKKKKAEEEAQRAKEAEEEKKKAEEAAARQSASKSSAAKPRPADAVKTQLEPQKQQSYNGDKDNVSQSSNSGSSQSAVSSVKTPEKVENTKPDLPPVQENTEVELPIDFN